MYERLYPIANQKIDTVSNLSLAPTNAFNELTTYIKVQPEQDVYMRLNALDTKGTVLNVTVTNTSDVYLKGGQQHEFAVGSARSVSFVRRTTDGSVFITEFRHPTERRTPL